MHKAPQIKLPRGTVRQCLDPNKGRSKSFSYTKEDLAGKKVIIFCTGRNGGVTDIIVGIVERVSHRSQKCWAVIFNERLNELPQ